ncbi:MAG TPA: aminopeptidase P family N-terminal domain-containing protein [Xanthobacteraceae bacterium]
MRRGLMARDENELPQSVLAARIEGLRAAMARGGLDGFVCYTNLVQPSAVTYLTGFTPYWSDGLLLVPRSGAPVFATALSKRVANWIASTNPVSEIVNTPKPGAALGVRLTAEGARRVGVLELERLPGGLYDEITGAAPALELMDGSAAFATLRRRIDGAERGLIERADALALSALAQIDPARVSDAGAAAGLVEKEARLKGAEEAYIAVAPDLAADRRMIRVSDPLPLADRFALRASVAYKGSWVRRTRTFAKTGTEAVARADAWFENLAASFVPGQPIGAQLTTRLSALPGAKLIGWLAESPVGSYPLEAIASARAPERDGLPDGGFAVLTVELMLDGTPWLGAAPVFA